MDFPFTRDRFTHTLLQRDGAVCLVERTNHDTGSVHWEVVRLHWERERVGPNGALFPAGERYPTGNDWGTDGWTYTSLADAEWRYRDLLAPKPEKGGSAHV
jgi:hypothetical protein